MCFQIATLDSPKPNHSRAAVNGVAFSSLFAGGSNERRQCGREVKPEVVYLTDLRRGPSCIELQLQQSPV